MRNSCNLYPVSIVIVKKTDTPAKEEQIFLWNFHKTGFLYDFSAPGNNLYRQPYTGNAENRWRFVGEAFGHPRDGKPIPCVGFQRVLHIQEGVCRER